MRSVLPVPFCLHHFVVSLPRNPVLATSLSCQLLKAKRAIREERLRTKAEQSRIEQKRDKRQEEIKEEMKKGRGEHESGREESERETRRKGNQTSAANETRWNALLFREKDTRSNRHATLLTAFASSHLSTYNPSRPQELISHLSALLFSHFSSFHLPFSHLSSPPPLSSLRSAPLLLSRLLLPTRPDMGRLELTHARPHLVTSTRRSSFPGYL